MMELWDCSVTLVHLFECLMLRTAYHRVISAATHRVTAHLLSKPASGKSTRLIGQSIFRGKSMDG